MGGILFTVMGQPVSPAAHACDPVGELTCSLDELVTHPAFSSHRLRIAEPKVCDPSVKQYSGYFDIVGGKHLFFWWVLVVPEYQIGRDTVPRFFESRNSPETSDFVYWTNGVCPPRLR
jgi:hypothetical protein